MKVGILTLMHGFNYGGMLQCYALVKYLTTLGCEVTVVNFNPSRRFRWLRTVMHAVHPSICRQAEDLLLRAKYGVHVQERFHAFRYQTLPLGPPVVSSSELYTYLAHFDAVIVGSDQVWNTNWLTPEYFLPGLRALKTRRISYAACFGSSSQSQLDQNTMGSWIRDFHWVTVRNEQSADLVYGMTGNRPQVVCDPTMLVDLECLQTEAPISEKRYMFLYALSQERLQVGLKAARARKNGSDLRVVAVRSRALCPWAFSGVDVVLEDPSVEQWYTALSQADEVITDSFHGMILGVKLGKTVIQYLGHAPSAMRLHDAWHRYRLAQSKCSGLPDDIRQLKSESRSIEAMAAHVRESKQFLSRALLGSER